MAFSKIIVAQTIARTTNNSINSPQVPQWDLNQYVWSHTHPLPKKGDKPLLDFNAIDNWISIADYQIISPDGQYVAYGIQRGVDYLTRRLDSIIVQQTDHSWRMAIQGVDTGFFSADSRLYIFKDQQRLGILQVGSDDRKYIPDVVSYKLPTAKKNEWLAYQLQNNQVVLQNLVTGNEKRFNEIAAYDFDNSGQWLICQANNEMRELILYNVTSQQERHFTGVSGYLFDAAGRSLILSTLEKANKETITAVQFLDLSVELANQSIKKIWSTADSGLTVSSYVMDGMGHQVAFMTDGQKSGNTRNKKSADKSIWYWQAGMDKAEMKVNNHSMGMGSDVYIQALLSFTDNDNYIQLVLKGNTTIQQPRPDIVKMTIWDYKDTILQCTQYGLLNESRNYNAIFNIKNNRLIRLEHEYEKIKALKGDYAVVATAGREKYGDRFWEKGYIIDSNWLISLQDGARRLLPTTGQQYHGFWFSPGGNYLVYFDAQQQCNYFSVNLHTGKVLNMSAQVPAWQLGQQDAGYYLGSHKWVQPAYAAGGLAGWLVKEEALMVYDDFDIWKLDLSGKSAAVNITNGFGRSHGIVFGLVDVSRFEDNDNFLPKDFFLRAFNIRNKNFGYYRKTFDFAGNPELLSMDACIMQTNDGRGIWEPGMIAPKAVDSNLWIVKRQTAMEPPNYYKTQDFKHFKRLSDIQPQKQYNWFTKELHSFKQLDGMTNRGLLYKPENFDPGKKYPVIIIIYNQFTDNLNQFQDPQYNEHAVSFGFNPGWLVSHGYLVFTPDIYVAPFQYGPSAYNIVEGAARYLKQLAYDGNHMGVCAHSWSAKLGAYIFTHSHSFAAMAISEGYAFSNPVSLALSTNNATGSNVKSELQDLEKGFEYGNLWEHKTSWLDQTAVLNADRASSPLLLFCGKRNEYSRINQTMQLFTALRRLQKKAWWLEYEIGDHVVTGYEARDFTIRFTQFFEHYLKGAPPPKWMTQGIPAKLQGIESGYEFDWQGSCGKDCQVCKNRNKK